MKRIVHMPDNVSQEIDYVVIILDKSADSFCYYNHDFIESELMPISTLETCIAYCSKNNFYTTILYGKEELPGDYLKLLNAFPHIRIKPYYNDGQYLEKDILTINFDGFEVFDNLPENPDRNIILRLKLSEINSLAVILRQYSKKYKRLNIFFEDILSASETALNNFRLDLKPVQKALFDLILHGEEIELSLATDRLRLGAMNNCNAGINHFTIAPNGKYYLCPGFYYAEPENAIGEIGEEFNVKNGQLLHLNYAPVCKVCDSFQCKRCVYMNQHSTLEINTPSYQQCVVSHHERNLSGALLQQLHRNDIFLDLPQIPALYYLDPFEIVKDKQF